MANVTDSEDDMAEGAVSESGAALPLPAWPSDASVPRHVALIPDGNRRWAKREGLDFKQAYRLAGRRLDQLVNYMVARGVGYVTVWPLAARNWQRERTEVEEIVATVRDYVRFARTIYSERGFRFRTIGTLDRIRAHAPELVQDLIAFERETANETRATIVMAFDYDGREEIARAVARMLAAGVAPVDMSRDSLAGFLDTSFMPDPDLIIRTGGEWRLSGFLLYQSEYAEMHFSDTLLPDLDESEVDDILKRYAARRYSQ